VKHPAYIDSSTAMGKPSPFDKEIDTSACSICSIAKSLETLPLKIIERELEIFFAKLVRFSLYTPSPRNITSPSILTP
jgi:hypothetical protein